jgi:hypothetical protein
LPDANGSNNASAVLSAAKVKPKARITFGWFMRFMAHNSLRKHARAHSLCFVTKANLAHKVCPVISSRTAQQCPKKPEPNRDPSISQ